MRNRFEDAVARALRAQGADIVEDPYKFEARVLNHGIVTSDGGPAFVTLNVERLARDIERSLS